MMGNRLGFCQLHLIDGGIDTGNIVKTEEFLYPPACRIPKDYEEIYYKKLLENFEDLRDAALCGSDNKTSQLLNETIIDGEKAFFYGIDFSIRIPLPHNLIS